ncbi:HAD family phosphatase [Clostridium sp.]|uniref:HAD family hydrolase n=1 Tax=Clostridium sp. TaxID=1506 RepID=UPI002617BF31|nr:HAD family phosphatase [Clostridium sp.]
MYKNIIFDLGNVLLSFNPKEYLNGKLEKSRAEKVLKEIFLSEEWIKLDEGTITEIEAIENISLRNEDYREDIKKAFENWYDILIPINETVEILKDLKENGYNLYYLSNFHDIAFKKVKEKYDFFNLFDGGVVSYEDKLLKPDERIYKAILERYSLVPKESIFIDDTKINVDAAKEVNIEAIVFENANKLKEDLKYLGLNISN